MRPARNSQSLTKFALDLALAPSALPSPRARFACSHEEFVRVRTRSVPGNPLDSTVKRRAGRALAQDEPVGRVSAFPP